MSTVILACCMEITRLYSAFFVSPKQLDDYKNWAVSFTFFQPDSTDLFDCPDTTYFFETSDTFSSQFFDQISYMKYGYVGLVLNEFRGKDFVCDGKKFCNGNDIMLDKGFDRYTINYCAGCMIAYIAVCRLTSYLALRFIKM